MVKRYDLTMFYFASGAGVPDMEEFENGDYVEHGDYAALAERCERLEAALRNILGEHANDNHRHKAFYIAADAIREIDT